MPGVTLHFLVAQRILDRWRIRDATAPFDLDRPDAVNAFFHGSIGPDLGFFPGGARILSDLAHCVRTGALTNDLVRHARTPVERAYAWGWMSHVLADRGPSMGRPWSWRAPPGTKGHLRVRVVQSARAPAR